MYRRPLLLGFLATGGQILLLRELVSSLGGAEVLVGVGLFGWLLWTGIGALWAGRTRVKVTPALLFVAAAVMLPMLLVAVRLAPAAITAHVGGHIPLWQAALVSLGATFPLAFLSGWLFPLLSPGDCEAGAATVRVYVWEGVGAFVAGVVTLMLVGNWFSSLTVSLLVGIVTIAGATPSSWELCNIGTCLRLVMATGLSTLAVCTGPTLNGLEDRLRYAPFEVAASFETRYGHQTLLQRAGSVVLVTDGRVEATWPDLEASEHLFIPPMLLDPTCQQVLVIGRSELYGNSAGRAWGAMAVEAVDNRHGLSGILDSLIGHPVVALRHNDDPVGFLNDAAKTGVFDAIILPLSDLTSYESARLLTPEALAGIRSRLAEGGVLYVLTGLDSERYLSVRTKKLLQTIRATLGTTFAEVTIWPGTRTAFLAWPSRSLNVPLDTLLARLGKLEPVPDYFTGDVLTNRLNDFRMERLRADVLSSEFVNSIRTPRLTVQAIGHEAGLNGIDSALVSIVERGTLLAGGTALLFVVLFVCFVRRKRAASRYSLFLFLCGGFISLAAELLSFYVLQATAGVLYWGMALLIGCFMLGLALGAHFGMGIRSTRSEIVALSTIGVALMLFWFTCIGVPVLVAVWYHALFLLVIALGTGSLFAAASVRRFQRERGKNRGGGYGIELLGSAISALLVLPVLLPTLGLTVLLTGLIALVITASIGSLITSR